MRRLHVPSENLKNYLFSSSYCLLQMCALKTCNTDAVKVMIASSFKLGQLEDFLVIFLFVLFFRVIALCTFGY